MNIDRAFCACFVALICASLAHASNESWTTATSGLWNDTSHWSSGFAPANGDQATFDKTGTYMVSFKFNPLIQDLFVIAGNVTFLSNGAGSATLNVNSTSPGGGQDVVISSGGTLTLIASVDGSLFSLNAGDDLHVQQGGILNVNAGSRVTTTDLFDNFGGAITIDGTGSGLSTTSSVQVGGLNGTSSLTFRNSGVGSLAPDIGGGTVTVGSDAAGVLNLESGARLDVGNLNIGTGFAGTGTVNVNSFNTSLTQTGPDTITLGAASGGASTINVGIAISGGAFTTGTGLMTVNTTGTVNVGSVSTSGTFNVNGALALSGTINVNGSGSVFTQSGAQTITVGGAGTINVGTSASGGTLTAGLGGMTINATGTVNVGSGTNVATLNANGNVNINGGTLTRGSHGLFNLPTERTMTITGGGAARFTGDYTTTSNAIYNVSGASSVLQVLSGNFIINNGAQVNLSSGGTIDTSGTVIVSSEGTLQAGSSISKPIAGTSFDAVINVTASGVSLGTASSFTGFSHIGVLNVANNTVTLNSAGYARLGVLTTLANGTINAPNGVVFATGSNLLGHGTVNARTGAELGSVIEADGALALGDVASPAGYVSNGELRTKLFMVTLNSSGAVGLGNLTTLGSGASPGALTATNGYVVDFDEAVTGYGTISSSNTLAKRAIINGAVQGNSAAQPITLSGYIKGLGTFSNVLFTGTFSPGQSPTIVSAGNLSFASSDTLIMELGGVSPGNGYDQIQSSGSLSFGGTLQVALINGFTPSSGQSFNLFDWATESGAFSLQLPTLSAGLAWDTLQLYTTGTLNVTSVGIPGDYNNNGVVDAADYVLWRKSPSTYGGDPAGYTTWRSHFGQPPGSGAGATGSANVAVTEPATLIPLVVGILVVSSGRRVIVS